MADQIIAERYKVLSKLGSGGAAIVYKVKDLSLKNVCALKTLRYEYPKPEHLIRFQREARSISNLKHPNIVRTLDFGKDSSNRPFLVMEYIEGVSLKRFLKINGPLPETIALSVVEQVCDALAYIHSNDVLHRDIKSENIMVLGASNHKVHDFDESPNLKVILLDFGLAKDFEDSIGKDLTKAGVAMGTPMYMSPEQSAGGVVDQRSEVYSVGCLLYEILTGVYPIKGGTALETIAMQQDLAAPRLSESPEGIEFSEELEDMVSRALEKDPQDRFQSMQEFKREIQIYSGDEPEIFDEEKTNLDIDEVESLSSQELSGNPKTSGKGVQLILIGAAFTVLLGSALLGYRLISSTHTTPAPKKIKAAVDFGFLSPDEKSGFISLPADSGIQFRMFGSMPNTTDKELLAVEPEKIPEVMSLCGQLNITKRGLAYVASLPIRGIGLNRRNLKGEELKLFAKKGSCLEIIWMRENPLIKDSDLLYLKNLPKLKYLSLADNLISDEALKTLASLPSLTTLKLEELKNLNGYGLKYLKDSKTLRNLCLSKNRLSKEGWTNLGNLKQLNILNLSRTNLTGESLSLISNLKLKKLGISQTRLTDKDLVYLYPMKSLELLYMPNMKGISKAGLAQLKKNLPDCSVRLEKEFSNNDYDPLLGTESSIK